MYHCVFGPLLVHLCALCVPVFCAKIIFDLIIVPSVFS